MELKASQSIQIFGIWNQPRRYLTWEDVKTKCMSWSFLRSVIGLSSKQLHSLQRNKEEWILRGGLTLHDLPDMLIFPINPFTDLKADLGEVWAMRWSTELLESMGVTYEQMRVRGLSCDLMAYFNMPLSAWQRLGFSCKHADALSNDDISRVFGMPRHELLDILREFQETA